jgi:hypothetical protein
MMLNLIDHVPIWLQWLIPLAAYGTILGGLLVLTKFVWSVWVNQRKLLDYLKQNRFDDITVAVTRVSMPLTAGPYAGYVVVHLRTMGHETQKFQDAIRGKEAREMMDAAARKCTWDIPRRFLLVGEKNFPEMKRVLLNWLGPKFTSADQQKWLLVGATGADADPQKHSKMSYRTVVVVPEEALRLAEHKRSGTLLFEDNLLPDVYHTDPKHSHMTRVGTVDYMALAMGRPDWRIDIPVNGRIEWHQICFPMQGELPAMPPLDHTKMRVIRS